VSEELESHTGAVAFATDKGYFGCIFNLVINGK
jgi:hypothetical protein